MRGAGAGDLDRGVHIVRNGEVEIVVRAQLDVEWSRGRRGEQDRVAGLRKGTGIDRRLQVDEAAMGNVGIDEHETPAGMLDELDAR